MRTPAAGSRGPTAGPSSGYQAAVVPLRSRPGRPSPSAYKSCSVEFIADASAVLQGERIWFMEINTRLQVQAGQRSVGMLQPLTRDSPARPRSNRK